MATQRIVLSEEERAAFAALGFDRPPTARDLPDTDGMPMDNEHQALQMDLLWEPLRLYFAGQDVYAGKNQIIYYSAAQVRKRDFLGPDVYVVLGVHDHMRPSWVIWDEGKAPDVVVEVLAPSTQRRDRGEKKRIYQDDIRAQEYFWYDPDTGERAGFALRNGRYEPLEVDAEGRMWSEVLGLTLVRWNGDFQGRDTRWLRWADADGVILPTRAEAERARADRAQRELEEARALLARYREQSGDASPN